jgi:3'-5' exoribonuclease
MNRRCISELSEGEKVIDHFLVQSRQLLTTKAGKQYISMRLQDKTGQIPARVWDNAAEFFEKFKVNDIIKVDADVERYNQELQLKVHRLRPSETEEVELSDFVAQSPHDIDEIFLELRSHVEGVENPYLKDLLNAFFEDEEFVKDFKASPAARNIHHVCMGGLLEHTLSTTRICEYLTTHYENLDADLLIAMAILHDIGKVEELEVAPAINYTEEGHLLGHIVIGIRMVAERIERIPGFPPKLRTLIEHMILSHHGQADWGSPLPPMFLEAEVLHRADDLDAKVNIINRALSEDRDPDSAWTTYHRVLERILYKKPSCETDVSPEEDSA